jgi:ribosome-associated protein
VAEENRGRDIVILDLRELTCVFDCFVLVSGASRRQLHSIADEINRTFKQEFNDRRMGIEGYEISKWILLDYGDIVVHLFEPETRAYYALEELWSQAPKIVIESSLGENMLGESTTNGEAVGHSVAEPIAAP